MAFGKEEHRKVIAFGTLALLEEWAAEGNLSGSSIMETIDGSFDCSEGDHGIYQILNLLKEELSARIKKLEHLRRTPEDETQLSHLRCVFSFFHPIWDEFRVKALTEGRRRREAFKTR